MIKSVDKNFMQYILLLLIITNALQGYTEICGKLDLPKSLTRSKSPYLITGDLYIPPSSRLTIESGVEVHIASEQKCHETKQQDYSDSTQISIKIDGSFFVDGNPDFPVIIKPQKFEPGQIKWDGIRIWNATTLNTQIQYLRIYGAHRAIHTFNSRFNISNSLFEYNGTGIYLKSNANVNIYNNTFAFNEYSGVQQESSAPRLYGNIFYKNLSYGIWSDSRQAPQIHHNGFWQNGEADCYHCPYQIKRIEETNWLGDSTDSQQNLFMDPLFVGTPSELIKRKQDLTLNTPLDQIEDSLIAAKVLEVKKRFLNLGITKTNQYKVLGKGSYTLSKYSPYVQAAPEDAFFLNTNDTRGDLGMHGGKPDRVKRKFPIR